MSRSVRLFHGASVKVELVSEYQFFPEPPIGGELIHTRRYEVRTYKMAPDRFLLRGVVVDEKPAGLYISTDPDVLWVHHMVVDLEVTFPMFEIEKVHVEFKERPHTHCTDIEPDYQKLVGLSIARGFNNKVKELFGGPRGCTHIGALLAAMAPVAIQSGWSMRAGAAMGTQTLPTDMSPEEQRKRAYAMNLNTCHMWDENGQMVKEIEQGIPMEVPLWITKRFTKLGLDDSEWAKFRG
jgi:hypothetical protein